LHILIDCEPQDKSGQESILDHLGRMLHSGTGSDPKFILKGEEILVHSFVLQGGTSPVLAAMFEHDMTESSSRTVEDIEPKVFRQLLSYVYTQATPPI